MRRSLLILAVFALPSLATAHNPPGTMVNYCEPGNEWHQHDFISITGLPPPLAPSPRWDSPAENGQHDDLLRSTDGNVGGDCDSSGLNPGDPGEPCAGFEDPNDLLSLYAGLCDADILLPAADWDGHDEWAVGGALILACESNCGFGGLGGGSQECYGAAAHHTEAGTFTVDDVVLGAGAGALVAADSVDATSAASGGTIPPSPCGDFENDDSADYIGGGAVPFPAGLDGSYFVYVQGTMGHVSWP